MHCHVFGYTNSDCLKLKMEKVEVVVVAVEPQKKVKEVWVVKQAKKPRERAIVEDGCVVKSGSDEDSMTAMSDDENPHSLNDASKWPIKTLNMFDVLGPDISSRDLMDIIQKSNDGESIGGDGSGEKVLMMLIKDYLSGISV